MQLWRGNAEENVYQLEQDDISVWNEASTKKAEFGDELSGPECAWKVG